MVRDKLINSDSKIQQDYFLLGACITNTLLLLNFVWRTVADHYKPNTDLFDILPFLRSDWLRPEFDVPLYIISCIFILASFVAYYFLNIYLSKRLDVEIKHLLSKGFLSLSVIALLGVHALYFIKKLSGAVNSVEIDIKILISCYLAIAISIMVLYLFTRFRQHQILERCIKWSAILYMGATGFSLVRSAYVHLIITFPLRNIIANLAYDVHLAQLSPITISLTILFILFLIGLLILFKNQFRFKNKIVTLLVDSLTILAIIYAVFNIQYGFEDSDFFIGPINDILHGKTLIVDSNSQYGLLSMYGLAFLFKSFGIPLTYGNFALLVTITFIASYIVIYIILRVWLKNIFLSIFGIFLIVQQNYFVYPALVFPQHNLRFGWWIPVMVLVLISTRLATGERSYLRCILRSLELLLVAIAFFWVFDAGCYVLGAYIATIFVEEFYNQSSFDLKIKKFLFRMAGVIAALLLMFAVINIFTFMRSHQWPAWYEFVRETFIYSIVGFGMLPMPETGLYILFVAVYVLSSSYIIVKMFFSGGKRESDLPIISFVTAFGIMHFIYFMGRTEGRALYLPYQMVIPFIMVICWFMLKGLNFALSRDGRDFLKRNILVIRAAALLFILLISVPLLFVTHTMIFQMANRENIIELINSRDDINRLIYDKKEQLKFQRSVMAIEENEKDREKIAVISVYDTYFLVETGKTNIMNSNNLKQFILTSQLEELASQLLDAKPNNIYIEHLDANPVNIYTYHPYYMQSVQWIKDKILTNYIFVENVGTLDRYTLR